MELQESNIVTYTWKSFSNKIINVSDYESGYYTSKSFVFLASEKILEERRNCMALNGSSPQSSDDNPLRIFLTPIPCEKSLAEFACIKQRNNTSMFKEFGITLFKGLFFSQVKPKTLKSLFAACLSCKSD